MLEYLQKFKELSPELRNAISGPEALAKINALEAKYGISLADVVIRVMVRDLALAALPGFFVSNSGLGLGKADELFNELQAGVLQPVLGYLNGADSAGGTKVNPATSVNLAQPTSALAKSPFFFDPEDEAEARQNFDRSNMASSKDNWQGQADAIINKLELTFGSEILIERLRNVITTYLSGVRNRIDTKLVLSKAIDQGGVSLDDAVIEQVFREADACKANSQKPISRPETQNILPVPEDVAAGSKEDLERLKALGARDFDYDLNALEQKSQIAKEQGAPRQAGRPKQEKESFNVADSDPFAYRRPKEAVGKVVMSDIKAKLPKVMGPLDELKYLDLAVFRRLAKQPTEAAIRIKDKLDLLEAELYSLKLEGIKAWRQSPVYQEYLRIADEAIKSGRGVGACIAQQLVSRPLGMTLAEFEAIMKLNKEVRY